MQTTIEKYQIFINNTWGDSKSGETFTSLDPATGDILAEVPRGTKEDIDLAVAAARRTFESDDWQDILPAERGRYLFKFAEAIRTKKDTLAKFESLDTGKPLTQAYGDVEVAARYCEYYGGVADKILGETIPVRPEILDYTLREPLGVSGQIVPWNYPIQIAMRGIAPAIAAGNTVVVKPAEDTPITALELAKIALEIGLPAGVLNVVTGYGREAGAALANHPDVNQLTFTGSVQTGITIMEAAAKNVVPVTLELGGKSPNIVFADADFETAVDYALYGIFCNQGQVCSAGSRLLLEESIYDAFIDALKERTKEIQVGPGLDSESQMGPVVSEIQMNKVLDYIEIGKKEGATLLV